MTRFEQNALWVILWQESPTIDAFCQSSSMDRRDASNWAAGLRRHGVPLKRMPRPGLVHPDSHTTSLQYEQLQELALKGKAYLETAIEKAAQPGPRRLTKAQREQAAAEAALLAIEDRERMERIAEHERNAAEIARRYRKVAC